MADIDKTKLSRIEQVLESVKRHNVVETDPDITFEFIMASCFPSIWSNVQKKLLDEHMAGYIEGLEEGKKLTNN